MQNDQRMAKSKEKNQSGHMRNRSIMIHGENHCPLLNFSSNIFIGHLYCSCCTRLWAFSIQTTPSSFKHKHCPLKCQMLLNPIPGGRGMGWSAEKEGNSKRLYTLSKRSPPPQPHIEKHLGEQATVFGGHCRRTSPQLTYMGADSSLQGYNSLYNCSSIQGINQLDASKMAV